MAKTVEATTGTDTYAALLEAEQALAKLTGEQNGIPLRFKRAAESGDMQAVHDLRRRRDELPIEIELASITASRLRIALDKETLAEVQEEFGDAQTALTEIDTRFRVVREELNAAAIKAGNLQSQAAGLRMDISERERRLSARIAAASAPPAPVMRSAYRGGAGPQVITG